MNVKRQIFTSAAAVVLFLLLFADSVHGAPRWIHHLPDATRLPRLSLDFWKFGPLLFLFVLWISTIRRVDAETAERELPRTRWNACLLLSAILGLLTAVFLPAYLVGLGIAALAYFIPVALFIRRRNTLVHPLDRVLTWGDIQRRLRGEMRVRRPVSKSVNASSPTAATVGDDRVVLVGKSSSKIADDVRLTEYARTSQGYQAAIGLITAAVAEHATDLHINPKENEVIARLRVNGELKTLPVLPKEAGVAAVNIFKVLADLDIAVKRRSQDGSFRADVDGRRLNFRVSTQNTQVGEKISIRILDPSQSLTKFHDLGISAPIRAKLRECLDRTHGLLLVCGPTGAGKSTTAYAALREIDLNEHNVMSVEDPIECSMPQIDQIEVNAKTGQTFETVLRSLLRQDPDMLLIGEIRDGESAKIACQAATTGMFVISTIHGTNPMSALLRMIELGVEPYSVCNAVIAILGQRLVRRLCDDCKQPYTPDEQTLAKLGLQIEDPLTFYRMPAVEQNDCPACNGRGVVGKTGIFEYLEMNRALRKLVRGKAGETQFGVAATEQGMSTMRDSGLSLVRQGIITVEEFHRVMNE